MNHCFAKSCVLGMALAALVTLATAAGAATVVVEPGSMNGWSLAFQANSGGADPVGEFARDVPAAPPAGSGAFHLQTLSPTNPPGNLFDPLQKAYLGTNNHSGVALKDITQFKYYTYLGARDFASGFLNEPGGQPPIIEIITDSGESAQQRRFQFQPYGWRGESHVQTGAWQEWDLMQPEDGHYHWAMVYYIDNANSLGDWNWVCNRYPSGQMKLATPVVGDVLDGYDPDFKLANQSGTSLSLEVGAGRASYKAWNPTTTPWTLISGWRWWREGSGINAYADKLLIEANGVQTIYDFEGGRVVGMSNRDATTGLMTAGVADLSLEVVLWGKVLANPAPTATEFYMDDGSGVTIKVVATNAAQAGEYWRAEGSLDTSATPATLTCATGDVLKLN